MKNNKKNQETIQQKISDPSFRNANTEHAARIMFLLGLAAYPVTLAVLLPTGIALDFNQNGESLRTSAIKRDCPHADKKEIKQIRQERNKRNLKRANKFALDLADGLYKVLHENTLGAAERKISERNAKYKVQIDNAEKEAKKRAQQFEIAELVSNRKRLMRNTTNLNNTACVRKDFIEFGLESLIDIICQAKKITADYDKISISPDNKIYCHTTITIDDKVRLDEMNIQIRDQADGEYKTVFTFLDKIGYTDKRFTLFGLCEKRQAELRQIEAENKTKQLRNQLSILKNEQHTK